MCIYSLKGPDRVRKRPAVVFGSVDSAGACEAVKMLLEIFFTEAALGFCKNISLTIQEDNSVVLSCDGRSFHLDETVVDGKPVWYNDFCELYAGFELTLTLLYASLTIPGLRCEYKDARNNLNLSYFYPEGVKNLMEKNKHRITPVFFKEIEATGKDRYDSREYTAKIRVYLAFADECGYSTCLHNYRNLNKGGRHFELIKESIACDLSFFCHELLELYQMEIFPVAFEEIANNILLCVETICPDSATRFRSFDDRDDICNTMIYDMAEDLIDFDSFRVYLRKIRISLSLC
ncbi:MAG: hypothetical protein IKB72_03440 [Ruminococcus sp.]|nr:hypothetical protein [Ruminococcus sp.]